MIANQTTYTKLQEGFEDLYVVFSVFDTITYPDTKEEEWIVSDRRMEVAVEGKCKFIEKNEYAWGNGGSYESDVVESPVWMTVAFLAEAMINKTGDTHHIFLEGIRVRKEVDGVKICEFVMGS